MEREITSIEPNEIFMERVKSNPILARTKCTEQLILISMAQDGRKILEETGNQQDFKVRLGREAESILVKANKPFVGYLLKKYHIPKDYEEDLIDAGLFGLLKAIRGFDLSKGVQFTTFAGPVIQNEILMEVPKLTGISRHTRSLLSSVTAHIDQMKGSGEYVDYDQIAKEFHTDRLALPTILAIPNRCSMDQPIRVGNDGESCLFHELISDPTIEDLNGEIISRLDYGKNMESLKFVLDPSNGILKEKESIVLKLALQGMNQYEIFRLTGISQSYVSRLLIRGTKNAAKYFKDKI